MARKKKNAAPTPVSTLKEFESDCPTQAATTRFAAKPAYEKSWWSKKLDDRRWQEKRNRILQRDSYICQMCGDEEDTSQVHVHHRYYRFRADPWDYPDEALITLCKACHKEAGDYGAIFDSTLKTYLMPAELLDLADMVRAFRDSGITSPIFLFLLQELLLDPDQMGRMVATHLSMAEAAGSTRIPRIIRAWMQTDAGKEVCSAVS